MSDDGGGCVVGLLLLGVGGYFAYQYSPIPECLQIAAILDEVSDKTMFSLRWGLPNKIDCVIAGEAQRQKWLSSAEIIRFNAFQLQESLSRPPR